MFKLFNLPLVMQILGAVVLGITVWKGVHGIWTFMLIAGVLLLYIGKHFNAVYNVVSGVADKM